MSRKTLEDSDAPKGVCRSSPGNAPAGLGTPAGFVLGKRRRANI